ncbi:interferon gamma receptor 1 [Enoplosus armatus]|uniref:interferon gamma receptor 1 n=1 Tax=Enoplosus armatus TaxID=215367 RepID=UPI003994C0AF
MPPDGAFTVLLLMVTGASAVVVLPPSNVTVSCQNVRVTVSWEYSKRQPQTSFRVQMRGSAGDYDLKETSDHQYDLSHLVWAPGVRYLDFLYATVTAIQGGDQSEPVESKTFSFNALKTVDIKCSLNFPSVDLNVADSGATVSFRNPLHDYSELKRAIVWDEAFIEYNVTSGGAVFKEDCTVKQENCKLSFSGGVEKCASLGGSLFSVNKVEYVLFNKMDSICPSSSTEVHMMTLVLLLSVIVFLITVATIIIYKTRAWTLKTPSPLKPEVKPLYREQDSRYYSVRKTDISTVVIDNKPCKKPSVSSEEENLEDCSRGDVERRLHGNQELEAERLIEERRRDDDSADDSVKTECISIYLEVEEEEEEEVEVSAYDCPHTLQVDMGDGDMATGYSKR